MNVYAFVILVVATLIAIWVEEYLLLQEQVFMFKSAMVKLIWCYK